MQNHEMTFTDDFLNDIQRDITAHKEMTLRDQIGFSAVKNGALSIDQKIELNRLKAADLSNLAASVRNTAVNTNTEMSPEIHQVVAAPKRSGAVESTCTDCDGSNPCDDCEDLAPDNKGAWIDINIPNQGDPTVSQTLALEAAKRKKTMVYAAIALASIILLIFGVKFFKKPK